MATNASLILIFVKSGASEKINSLRSHTAVPRRSATRMPLFCYWLATKISAIGGYRLGRDGTAILENPQ